MFYGCAIWTLKHIVISSNVQWNVYGAWSCEIFKNFQRDIKVYGFLNFWINYCIFAWWSMGEHKKPNRVELHVIPISIQGVSDVGDSIDSCMETRKKEVLTRNRSAVSSVCPSRKSYTSRRCFTAIERPKRSRKFCQACAYQDVKQIEQDMEVVIFFPLLIF